MKMRVKNRVLFSVLVPLFAFMALTITTCEVVPPPYVDEDDPEPNVVYSTDWRLITIYLNGIIPIEVKTATGPQRTMTPDTARYGFDHFEVIFYYKGIYVIEKWGPGNHVPIEGIYRNGDGIDYSAVNLEEVKDSDNGCAMLFAGKSDGEGKTLLGVGRVVAVDGEPGALIKEKSVAVTFEVSCLTGGTSFDVEKSSFLTNTGKGDEVSTGNTKIMDAIFNERHFPLYPLPLKKIIEAKYKIGMYNGVDDIVYGEDETEELLGKDDIYNYNEDYNVTDERGWADYLKSIVVVGESIVHPREARYPAGEGYYFYPRCEIDKITQIKITNNNEVNKYFNNVIDFELDTTGEYDLVNPKDKGIFTLSFSVPVYLLDVSFLDKTENCWYIRPAYGSYYYNIDHGVTGNKVNIINNGGGVLIGVGKTGDSYGVPADMRGGGE